MGPVLARSLVPHDPHPPTSLSIALEVSQAPLDAWIIPDTADFKPESPDPFTENCQEEPLNLLCTI